MKLILSLVVLILCLSIPEAECSGKINKAVQKVGTVTSRIAPLFGRFFGGFGGGGGGGGDDDDDEDEDKRKRFVEFAERPTDLLLADSYTSKEMHAKCRHNNFEVKLGMYKAHLMLIFVPQPHQDQSKGVNCSNHFIFHSWTKDNQEGQLGIFQEFTPFKIAKTGVELLKIGEVHGSRLGSQLFSEAYPDHVAYDPIESNCAKKIIHLLDQMSISITYGIGNFVVDNLIKEATFLQSVRSSPHMPKLFPSASAQEIQKIDDVTLANALVQYTVKKESTTGMVSDSYQIATIVLASLLGTFVFVSLVALLAWTMKANSRSEKC